MLSVFDAVPITALSYRALGTVGSAHASHRRLREVVGSTPTVSRGFYSLPLVRAFISFFSKFKRLWADLWRAS